MKSPLHPALFRYLRSIQSSDRVGLHGFFRDHNSAPSRSARTVYRWQRTLGDQLLVIPNVLVEGLGLRHAHLFVTKPDESWLSLPYAVEAAWVTPDFCQEVCYLHCLVPASLDFAAVLQEYPCARYEVVWSSTGWQQFLNDVEEIVLPVATEVSDDDLVHRSPFVIPAMMELWQYPNSLPLAWQRIKDRLGSRVKEYLPRTKVRYTNGKNHLTSAFRLLKDAGLLGQHVIRYHPLLAQSVEVFAHVHLDRDDVTGLLRNLRGTLHAIETYPTGDGYWCRLLGPHQLLDALLQLPLAVRERVGGIYFHTKRHPAPMVRFAYEAVFDPTTGTWSGARDEH
jgi:hypothetical protein